MLVSDGYAPQRTEHATLHGPTAASVTELLQLPARTMEQFTITSQRRGHHTVGSGGHERHSYLDSGATAQCEPL